ncbi:MAG TPA: amino acid ABC transporter substrate-binding protein [Streptosporangiaceae bacterium]|jgi:branched-chain amino acid transport system substrate-binding protein|nr:amino acid ABC transporter substrate-binding protein [Streptosporangiaceae bacterium]
MRSLPHRARYLAAGASALLATALLAACGSGGTSSAGSSSPILIGASLSLTGDFSADGQAYQRGYELWASDVNAHGGIDGRKVKLIILNDNSSPTQVDTNYTDLITVKHVNLTFGPFSSLLTAPAAEVAHRYGFAFIEGAGGSPLVFSEKLPNVFDVSLPVANELDPFASWVASLSGSQKPATAAYPMANDPFAIPQVQRVQGLLQAAGVSTVYSKIFPEEVPDYLPNADIVAGKKPQAVVLGSTDVPTVASFMHGFEQQHFNPKVFVAAAGPDQGQAFLSAVGGAGNANGMMVPDAWYPGYDNATSKAMVAEYVKKYGGSASDVNADVAEAYSVGEVTAQAVKATGGTGGSKIIAYLHSGVTLTSVQGPVKFNSLGENVRAIAFIFQWQNGKFVQILPANAAGSVPVLYPKPDWSS